MMSHPNAVRSLFLALMFTLLPGSTLLAQCDRVGWVASVTPDCGAVIKELNSGLFLRAVAGTELLVGGKTISFSTVPAPALPICLQDGLPTMALTCVTDVLFTEALFTYTVSPDNPLQYTFQAKQYDPATQACQWSFGDGPVVGASGAIVEYTFSQPGVYNVCLKIAGNSPVAVQSCLEVLVSGQPANTCGYSAYVTAVGTQLYAKLLPQNSAVGTLTAINWHNGQAGELLGQTPSLSAPLPGFGDYLICAEYTVKNTVDSAVCTASVCKALFLSEPGCADAQVMATVQICPAQEPTVPVCGCDEQTYANECEALAAGMTTWWAGDCSTMYGSCVADMAMEIIAGSPDLGYTVRFLNLSGGNSSLCHLDFGDGSPIWEATQWDSVTHHYAKGDVYRVSLSVWKQSDCASSVTKLLVTDAFNLTIGNLPSTPDYVLPGDANGDKKANVYDLLDIGVGYLSSGSPRPNASSDWLPQFAANWPDQLEQTLNFKHFDCDGDGVVLDMDVDVIEPHYAPIDSNAVSPIPGAPAVWVEFEQDTIVVDASNPTPFEITANVMVGNADAPALGLHGLAFALKYPEYVEHDPEVDYKNDFFGISNHILWMPKDNYSSRQLDLGFTRKYENAAGYGRIATVTFRSDFIIIIDVIAREEGEVKAFAVPIRGLKAVGADGQELEFGSSVLQDTVWIKLLETSGTRENALNEQVTVYPNPAAEEALLLTGALEVERVEALNALGQVIYSASPVAGQVQRLRVADWPAGLYTIHLQTTRGLVEKKLLVP